MNGPQTKIYLTTNPKKSAHTHYPTDPQVPSSFASEPFISVYSEKQIDSRNSLGRTSSNLSPPLLLGPRDSSRPRSKCPDYPPIIDNNTNPNFGQPLFSDHGRARRFHSVYDKQNVNLNDMPYPQLKSQKFDKIAVVAPTALAVIPMIRSPHNNHNTGERLSLDNDKRTARLWEINWNYIIPECHKNS